MDMTSRIEDLDDSYDSLMAYFHVEDQELSELVSRFTDALTKISPELFATGWCDVKAMRSLEFVPIALADKVSITRSATNPSVKNVLLDCDSDYEAVTWPYLLVFCPLFNGATINLSIYGDQLILDSEDSEAMSLPLRLSSAERIQIVDVIIEIFNPRSAGNYHDYVEQCDLPESVEFPDGYLNATGVKRIESLGWYTYLNFGDETPSPTTILPAYASIEQRGEGVVIQIGEGPEDVTPERIAEVRKALGWHYYGES